MRFINILAGSALFPFTGAFQVPKGTTDGFYKVHRHAQGQEIHERVSNFETEATPAEVSVAKQSRIEKRESHWFTWCGCGIELNHGNCDDAVQDLKDQMGSTFWVVGPQTAFYSIRGDAVAFSCNNADGDALTSADWMTQAAEVVTRSCGWYIAGTGQWAWITPGANSTDMGYMIWRDGVDFCGDAQGSPDWKC